MAPVEQRFLTGAREEDRDEPGLVLEDDGTVWLVAADGTRTRLPGAGNLPDPAGTPPGALLLTDGAAAAWGGFAFPDPADASEGDVLQVGPGGTLAYGPGGGSLSLPLDLGPGLFQIDGNGAVEMTPSAGVGLEIQSPNEGAHALVARHAALVASLQNFSAGVAAPNTLLDFTAVEPGEAGNSITVYVGVDDWNEPLSVSVVGTAIHVAVETDAVIGTSTANEVIEAVNAHPEASALVQASNSEGSDGTGVLAITGGGGGTLAGGAHADDAFAVGEDGKIVIGDGVRVVSMRRLVFQGRDGLLNGPIIFRGAPGSNDNETDLVYIRDEDGNTTGLITSCGGMQFQESEHGTDGFQFKSVAGDEIRLPNGSGGGYVVIGEGQLGWSVRDHDGNVLYLVGEDGALGWFDKAADLALAGQQTLDPATCTPQDIANVLEAYGLTAAP